MRFTTNDILTEDHDGLMEVSFGGPNDTFLQLGRLTEVCCQRDGVADRGMADIYVVINDQVQSTQGGIIECVLTNTRFIVKFDNRASAELQSDCVDVTIVASDEELKRLQNALQCIFRNVGVFKDKTNLQDRGLIDSSS